MIFVVENWILIVINESIQFSILFHKIFKNNLNPVLMQHILNFYSLFKYLRLREEKFINLRKIVFKKFFTKCKSVSFVVKFIFLNFFAQCFRRKYKLLHNRLRHKCISICQPEHRKSPVRYHPLITLGSEGVGGGQSSA